MRRRPSELAAISMVYGAAVAGKRFAHLVGAFKAADAAANGVACLKELKGDVAAKKSGNAGDQNLVGQNMFTSNVERNIL